VKFPLAALVGQSVETLDDAVATLRRLGHVGEDDDESLVARRVAETQRWLAAYAPDSKLRIELNDGLPADLEIDDDTRAVFGAIADDLQASADGTVPLTEAELKTRIFLHVREAGLEQRPFFTTAYRALLGRESGPQLATFLASVGARAVPLLREAAG